MKIGIPKERREDERRAAASPETVKRYKGMGLEPVVEAGAGAGAAVADQVYEQAGASVADEAGVWDSEIVLKVQRPTEEEMGRLKQGQILIGMLDPYNSKDQVEAYAKAGVSSFALELLPRTTRAQAMDVLSSQANLAGYKALIDAMAEYTRVLPMMMTAAGTVTPAKVFIVGAGVAGLQAIATARRMGAVVTATDVRPAAREETESLGAKFVGFVPTDAATKGGYARPLTPEEQAEQARMVAEHLKTQDIVVTTAQIPGRKPGKTVTVGGGVKLIGARNLPARIAPATTVLYAKNLMNFVQLLVDAKTKELKIDTGDELIKGTLLTTGGAVVHDAFKPAA
jgi:H+-translocating NAD(P) transhydrogenase subunit alpha